ncbi:MAG TPA: serine hydrolase [Gemmataceae bacterium]|nr:serine hydrolase [Gemmataceae bacterium]
MPSRLPSIGMSLAIIGLTAACLPCRAADVPPSPKYEAAVRALERFIADEVKDKDLPALSIALVDDQTIVWSHGFGYADAQRKVPASADTVYRVGSVSKLFTDLAVMQLVEKGALDLDTPITRYLPQFHPHNPSGKSITLRQLMAHRAGLVREPPVGNYFDPAGSSLAQMVRSLNETALVYEPEQKTKYSNAGVAVVGYVLEKTQRQPFAHYLQQALLSPLGMTHSSFEPTPALTKKLASAVMWTYHDREFPAPTFELGMAPAGSMYSTVEDLSRFLSMLFAGGKVQGTRVIQPATLQKMWTPQFAKPKEKNGFGLGFMLSELDGHRRIGHSGAIYGFATQLAALPDEKLGVVVITSRDAVNAVTNHIADVALRLMLAAQAGKTPPAIEHTKPLSLAVTRKLAGHYEAGRNAFDLSERAGKLWFLNQKGGFRLQLRKLGDDLIVDGRLGYDGRLKVQGDHLVVGKSTYKRVEVPKPPAPPAHWLGLIGEYGWDHETLYIFEKDRKLHALIEWFFVYPLTEISPNVYRFPDYGLYQDETLVFTRDKKGRATRVNAANIVFPRRQLDGEDGRTFRIQPIRPIAEIRKEALAAQPPKEKGPFRPQELVDVVKLDPTLRLDIRYAGTNNFLSTPLYTTARAFMQRPAAEALCRVQKKLRAQGFGLLIHDAYRPWYVTKMFWEATPPRLRVFVADPAQGSRHNRGCAVDLTLCDLKTGKPIEMVGGYDEMSDRSYPDYLGGTSRQRWHRDLLRRFMEDAGFAVYDAEWWHFDYKDWPHYRIGTVRHEEIEK